MIRFVYAVVAAVVLLPSSTLWAGNDNGSKNDARIIVRNDSNQVAGVGLDLDLPGIGNANDPLGEFEDQGGRILNPGQQVEFKVKSGTQQVTFAFASALDQGDATLVAQQSVSVTNRQTVRLVGRDANQDDIPELIRE